MGVVASGVLVGAGGVAGGGRGWGRVFEACDGGGAAAPSERRGHGQLRRQQIRGATSGGNYRA